MAEAVFKISCSASLDGTLLLLACCGTPPVLMNSLTVLGSWPFCASRLSRQETTAVLGTTWTEIVKGRTVTFRPKLLFPGRTTICRAFVSIAFAFHELC